MWYVITILYSGHINQVGPFATAELAMKAAKQIEQCLKGNSWMFIIEGGTPPAKTKESA
jgi:hypothetical protein